MTVQGRSKSLDANTESWTGSHGPPELLWWVAVGHRGGVIVLIVHFDTKR